MGPDISHGTRQCFVINPNSKLEKNYEEIAHKLGIGEFGSP